MGVDFLYTGMADSKGQRRRYAGVKTVRRTVFRPWENPPQSQ